MVEENTSDLEIMDVYAMFWRLLQMNVGRFGSFPTGELLMVLTIVLLADADYYPTVTELSDLTGLPKSTVSRYVSTEMSLGYLEEIIDPRDRRRRLLRVTHMAEDERAWYRDEILGMVQKTRVAFDKNEDGHNPGTELKNILQGFSRFKS